MPRAYGHRLVRVLAIAARDGRPSCPNHPLSDTRSEGGPSFVDCGQLSSDWEKNEGVIRQADARGMGIALMRPMRSGVCQPLVRQGFLPIDIPEVDRLLLDYVL